MIPDAGSVVFKNGKDLLNVHSESRASKNFFGFSAQEPSFYLKLTVEENLYHFGSLYGLHRKDRVKNAEKLLKLVGLQDHRKLLSYKMSGGMRKRLGFLNVDFDQTQN